LALTAERPAAALPSAAAPGVRAARSPWLIIAVVMLGNFVGPLYSSVANVALPNLVAAFGSDIDTMQWVVSGYMLGYSISMPIAGWLADTYGRRRMFLIGIVMFTTFSILTALAWDTYSLIAFRILQAIGGGILSPTSMAIITDLVPPSQRGRALGVWGLGMMMAPAFGPWLSGMILDASDDWRLIFLVGVPVGIAGLIMAHLFIPAGEDRAVARRPFDLPGAALLSSSLALLLVPLTQVDRLGWDDSLIELSFVLAAVAFAGFVWRELVTPYPMLDLALFRAPTFAVAIGLRSAMGMGYYFAIFLLPLFTQNVLGWPPTLSGLVLIPGGVATALLMPLTGWLADRIGSRPLVFAGMVTATVGTFLFAQIDLTWDANRIALVSAVRMAALGLLFTPLTAAALAVVPRHRTGSASAILNTVWQVSGSLGIAIGQTYLTSRTALHLARAAGDAVLSRPAVSSLLDQLGPLLAQHGAPPQAAAGYLAALVTQAATVRAYGDTFMFAAVLLAVGTPLALFLGRPAQRPAVIARSGSNPGA
jgi:EmrB/QacA subfamily drug resistance transporter